ncbi:MAG: type IV toxin-antitoxin system AbiEi family antitoxin domain-containing protein [Nocardioides sp.]
MDDRLISGDVDLGLFTRSEVLAAGYDDNYITRMVRAGIWHRVRNGAFIGASIWESLNEVDRHRVRARAVRRKARSDGVLSHVSALAEFGVPFWDLSLDDVHLTRFDQRAGRREAGVCQHRGLLLVGDVTRRNGVMVTSPVRTALDVMATTDSERGMVVGCSMTRGGLCTLPQLKHAYAAIDPRAHSLATRVVLGLVDARFESVGEMRTAFHLWAQGLPRPEPQFEIRVRGRLVAQLDFAWPEHRVWLEFDGRTKYVDLLRDGETTADVVLREKHREDAVRRITGWICIRVTWADLYHPERLARRIRQAFRDQAAA